MKTKIIITTLVILGLLGLGYAFTLHPRMAHVPIQRVVYLLDMTDTFKIVPEPNDVKFHFSWNELKQSRETKVREITDVDQSDAALLELDAYNVPGQLHTWDMMGNDIFRKEHIGTYKADVQDTIASFYNKGIGYPNTSLLVPMIEELARLQANPHDDRYMLVYSDLRENRETLSFLDTTMIARMKSGDVSIWEAIPEIQELHDLSGITIYFIHRPKDGFEGERYRIVSAYLKERLESYGAKVIVQGKIIHSKNGSS